MESKSPETLAQMLVDAGFTSGKPVIGCTQGEIASIAQHYQITLPKAYRHFLMVMGRHAGDFLEDCGWDFESLDLVQESAEKRAELTEVRLPSKAFAFVARDNFILYFDTGTGSDDPPVFILEDGHTQPRKFYDSFSEWLTVCVTEEVRTKLKNDLASRARK